MPQCIARVTWSFTYSDFHFKEKQIFFGYTDPIIIIFMHIQLHCGVKLKNKTGPVDKQRNLNMNSAFRFLESVSEHLWVGKSDRKV